MEKSFLEEQPGLMSVSAHMGAEQVWSLPVLIRECWCCCWLIWGSSLSTDNGIHCMVAPIQTRLHGASAMDKIIGIFKCETTYGAGMRVVPF